MLLHVSIKLLTITTNDTLASYPQIRFQNSNIQAGSPEEVFSKEMAQSEQAKDMLAEGLVTGPWDKEKCTVQKQCTQSIFKNKISPLF